MPQWNKELGTSKVEIVSDDGVTIRIEPLSVHIYPVAVRWVHSRRMRTRCDTEAELKDTLDVLLPVTLRWNDIGKGCETVCHTWDDLMATLEDAMGDAAAITHYQGPEKPCIGLDNPERLAALERATRRIQRKLITVQPARRQTRRKAVVLRVR